MIKRLYFFVLILVLSAIVMAPGGAIASTQDEIKAGTAEWVKQYNAGNAAGVAALYTDDAKLMPPNSDFVTGREAMSATFKGMMDSGAATIKLDPVEVDESGNSAVEVGTYEVMDKDGKAVDKGKYIVQWKKVGTKWKLHRDIWNSSMPAPTSEMK